MEGSGCAFLARQAALGEGEDDVIGFNHSERAVLPDLLVAIELRVSGFTHFREDIPGGHSRAELIHGVPDAVRGMGGAADEEQTKQGGWDEFHGGCLSAVFSGVNQAMVRVVV